MNTAPRSMPLRQAMDEAPTLARLAAVARQSQARLQIARTLVPPELGAQLKAGALEDGVWTLLAPHSAAAAKLRQLLPQLVLTLEHADLAVQNIRVKVTRP
ncbi:MAG: DUF721 domain-containing protein [Burkholderiaceae bacterium]|jgi:hypothetical protein|nr:DUF721 domain-containing protein [Burkholderiaceae bacterium]